MRVEQSDQAQTCDYCKIKTIGKYTFVSEGKKNNICLECMQALYKQIGSKLIPSSPNAPFKPKKENKEYL